MNGLAVTAQPPNSSHRPPEGPESFPVAVSTSTSETLALVTQTVSVVNATMASGSSTRFRVQPTCTSQSVTYNQSRFTSANSGASIHTVGSAITARTDSSNATQSNAATLLDKGNKKRVYFPEGQALIKGFAHAPNPWYNGEFDYIIYQ